MGACRIAGLALFASTLLGAGCAESFCADPENRFEAMCQLLDGSSPSAFSIAPSRIEMNKDGATPVTVTAYMKFANQLVTVKQAGGAAETLTIGIIGTDGILNATIQANQLTDAGFVPGPAIVEIGSQRQYIRLFVAPKFDTSMFSATHDTSNDNGNGNMASPSWVGVQASGGKKILTLNEYAIATIAKQAIGEYTYDPTARTLAKSSPLLFSAYNSTPTMDVSVRGVGLSMTDFVVPEFGNASTSLLTRCSLSGTCSGSTAVPYGSIASLNAAPNGQLYTGVFNGKVVAFFDPELTTKLGLTGMAASTAAPAFIAVYNGNDDMNPDISVWHSDGNVSVALADATGKNLSYDANAGAELKKAAALSSDPADAVGAADLDLDGLEDVVVVKGRFLFILTNLGGGRYAAGDAITLPAQGPMGGVTLNPVRSIAVADVSPDGLGMKDLVFASKTGRQIAVMENGATLR